MVDNSPKINQEYHVKLSNVRTDGVRDTGEAALDPQSSVAILTIEGGNDPHGIISFAPSSLERKVTEGDKLIPLTVDRKFGAIGERNMEK